MKKNILALGLISIIAVACTLSVSDKNPKGVSLFGTSGLASASIADGKLTLSGSNLNHVQSLTLVENGGAQVALGPILNQTPNLLTVALPTALKLPGMLIAATVSGAVEVELKALDTLTVEGTMDVGFEKVQNSCAASTGFCSVTCPVGKRVVTGGCFASTANVGLSANYPSGDNQWTCRPAASSAVDAYAICGRVALTY